MGLNRPLYVWIRYWNWNWEISLIFSQNVFVYNMWFDIQIHSEILHRTGQCDKNYETVKKYVFLRLQLKIVCIVTGLCSHIQWIVSLIYHSLMVQYNMLLYAIENWFQQLILLRLTKRIYQTSFTRLSYGISCTVCGKWINRRESIVLHFVCLVFIVGNTMKSYNHNSYKTKHFLINSRHNKKFDGVCSLFRFRLAH